MPKPASQGVAAKPLELPSGGTARHQHLIARALENTPEDAELPPPTPVAGVRLRGCH